MNVLGRDRRPNGVLLSCAAERGDSQTEDYHRNRRRLQPRVRLHEVPRLARRPKT